MSTVEPRNWISNRYRSFDGLRGIAILMVFAIHYGYMAIPAKYVQLLWTGVDLFFVLSGFLITGILCDSSDSPTYFRDFYIRRALRIFPLYYGFFLAVALFTRPLHLHYDPILWINLLYLMNFSLQHLGHQNPTILFIGHLRPQLMLGVLWSLCVEEHFYLVWPSVVRLFHARRRALIATCLAGIVAVMTLRTALYFHNPAEALQSHYLYIETYTRCDTLLLGACLALCLREWRITPQRYRMIAFSAFTTGTVAVGLGLFLYGKSLPWDGFHPIFSTYGYTFVGIAAVGIVMLAIDDASFLSRLLRNRYLARLGTISYGVYFLHAIPMNFFDRVASRAARWHLGGLVVLVAFACSCAAALLSYRFLEAPFLRLKDRLAPPVAHESVPAGIPIMNVAG